MIHVGATAAKNTKSATIQINMISFVYFDVGGTIIKDFSETNKREQLKDDTEMSCGRLPIEPFLVRGFVSRFEKNESIWPIIFNVKKHYRVGLLTNMYPGMLTEIKKQGLMPEVQWDLIIDSSVEGFAKPGKEIYEIAQKRADVKAEELFFIDNTLANVETAKDFGWRTFWYDSKNYEDSSSKLAAFLLNESSNAS